MTAILLALVVLLLISGSASSVFGALRSAQPRVLQGILSFAILAVSLAIILSTEHAPHNKPWAYGAIGVLLGFWVKAPK